MISTHEEPGWTYVSERKSIQISKKNYPGSTIECMRGIGIINAPAMAIVHLFKQFHRRSEWDELVKESTVVEAFGDEVFVIRMAYRAVWPTSARDFCNCKPL